MSFVLNGEGFVKDGVAKHVLSAWRPLPSPKSTSMPSIGATASLALRSSATGFPAPTAPSSFRPLTTGSSGLAEASGAAPAPNEQAQTARTKRRRRREAGIDSIRAGNRFRAAGLPGNSAPQLSVAPRR